MNIVLISAVRDFDMHTKRIKDNPFCRGCEIAAIDNRERNDGIGVCYNRFLDSRPVDEDAWYVFCHEDFETKEPLADRLTALDPSCLWGPIGAATRVIGGIYHQWRLLGSVEECKKDGSCRHTIGTAVPFGTAVETFDCQCLIVHSSLIRKHGLRFDENLTFDLYIEDFCIAAHEKAAIPSRILPLAALHWSGGSVQPRYYRQEAYLNAKYPTACYTGTSSWILGGNPPFFRRLTVTAKRLARPSSRNPTNVHLAIHIHVFYLELWPELLSCIKNYIIICGQENVDVFVTHPDSNSEIPRAVIHDLPQATLIAVANRGYDIGPFIEVLHRINVSNYDFIVKLHTKRDVKEGWVNFRRYTGSSWRNALLSFCSSTEAVARSLRAFASDSRLGMVADWHMIDPSGIGSCHHTKFTDRGVRDLGLTPSGRTIVWGTMFMVRAELMRPFLKWSITDFDPPSATAPHEIEGLASTAESTFGMSVNAQGFLVSDPRHGWMFRRLFYPFLRLCYITLRYASDWRR